MTSNPMDAHAVRAGAEAHKAGQPYSDNPYFSWTAGGGTVGGTLAQMWASGWNQSAGRCNLTRFTPEEFAEVDARARANRAAYEARRDPAAAKRTASRKARKLRAKERARQAAAEGRDDAGRP